MMEPKIGIIGGSGLDNIADLLQEKTVHQVSTPFGKPAADPTEGVLNGVKVVLLPRHGRKHEYYPTTVPFRANLLALKQLGCTHVIAATACGSLREEYKPGHFSVLTQFIDRTSKRACTYYDHSSDEFQGVLHIPMAHPFCPKLNEVISSLSGSEFGTIHSEATMVTIEGPRFSTKAESMLFRSWNADLINMSSVPEVVLARELGLCYAAIGMVTDYDCWSEEEVSVAEVLKTFSSNAERFLQLVKAAVEKVTHTECSCMESWKTSFM